MVNEVKAKVKFCLYVGQLSSSPQGHVSNTKYVQLEYLFLIFLCGPSTKRYSKLVPAASIASKTSMHSGGEMYYSNSKLEVSNLQSKTS